MLGFVLDVVFTLVAIRAIWKLLQGIKAGMSVRTVDEVLQKPRTAPEQGLQMVKDPVCGTYVVPDHAVSINVGRQTLYFCSTACRDKFRAKTA